MANRIAAAFAYVKRVLFPVDYEVSFIDRRKRFPTYSYVKFRKKRHAYVYIDHLLAEGAITNDDLVLITIHFRVNLNC